MLQSLLSPWCLGLAVGRLEVVLKPEVSEAGWPGVGWAGPASSSLAEADVDVAGQQRSQSVLPVFTGEILLEVRSSVARLLVVQPLAQAESSQAQAGA